MHPSFQQLTTQQATKFVHASAAFSADFAAWVSNEIDSGDPQIFLANLAPIKFHWPLGSWNRQNRLSFELTANEKDHLRFKGRDFSHGGSCKLETLGPHGIVLVLAEQTAVQPGVDLTVNARNGGDIIRYSKLGQDLTRKQIYIWHFKIIDPVDMVGWYDPAQLVRTGVEVFFSTLFGRHADHRLMEALTPIAEPDPQVHQPFHDFTGRWKVNSSGPDTYDPNGEYLREIWLDYVGDPGDGWNSTYAIAHSVAQPNLTLQNPRNKDAAFETKRGDILVLGGDQVYPTANRLNYEQRLIGPYETALDKTDSPHPHAFAIPGNHDWYDSLVSFTRLFCQRRWFAGWQTDQSRSYFALKLPGHWWLLGADIQLDSDIDWPQVDFFKDVAEKFQPGDRVILCTAEPHWVYAKLYGKNDSEYNENNLAFLTRKILEKAKVVAFIAGDLHHYRRHQGPDLSQKITAGGGGAFLHGTHGEDVAELSDGYQLKTSYPQPAKSRRLGWQNIWFLWRNPRFGILTGAVYVLTAQAAMANVGKYGIGEAWPALKATLRAALINPFALFWILTIFVGFLLFTDTHFKSYRWIAGPIHGLTHLAAAFFIGWTAAHIAYSDFHWAFRSTSQLLFSLGFIFLFGAVLGPTIMGLYLYLSLNWFGRHSNEAFSALKMEDYKNFLRLRIEDNGNLTIFPIGYPKIPRKWKPREDDSKVSGYEPEDKTLVPELIEQPLLFKPINDQTGSVELERL